MSENVDLAKTIAGCKKKEAESFALLVDTYSGRLFGYFYRLTGNRQISEDLLSELFVKLVERIDGFRGGNFESWLFKIARNIFRDYLRAKQRYIKLKNGKKKQIEENAVETKTARTDTFDKLQIQLDKLDADTRELIMLRFYSQLSFKEISKMRGEPIGTVLSKVHRGLKKLRKLMVQ